MLAEKPTMGDNRRTNKPIMEKRRRARINTCLNDLKTLILEALKKDPSRHSKLEKADILEMTVKHLKYLHRQQVALAAVTNPIVSNKFRAGFDECTAEVQRCLGQMEGLDPCLARRLLGHLTQCAKNLNSPSITPPMSNGLHLVPTRLPNGEIAFLLPEMHSSIDLRTQATITHQLPPSTFINAGNINQVQTFVKTTINSSSDYKSPPSDFPRRSTPLIILDGYNRRTNNKNLEMEPWRPWCR